MRDVLIVLLAALTLLLSLGLWLSHQRQIHRLRRELEATRQELEIQRIIAETPRRRERHLRVVKAVLPVAFVAGVVKWIGQHPGPAATLAASAAVLAVLVPASVPHEPSRPPIASPGPVAPVTSPPAPSEIIIPPDAPDPQPPVVTPAPDRTDTHRTGAEGHRAGHTTGHHNAEAADTAPPPAPEPPPAEDTREDGDGDADDETDGEDSRRTQCLQVLPRPTTDINACVATVAKLVEDAATP